MDPTQEQITSAWNYLKRGRVESKGANAPPDKMDLRHGKYVTTVNRFGRRQIRDRKGRIVQWID